MIGQREGTLGSPAPAFMGAAHYGEDWNPGREYLQESTGAYKYLIELTMNSDRRWIRANCTDGS